LVLTGNNGEKWVTLESLIAHLAAPLVASFLRMARKIRPHLQRVRVLFGAV
jgi:hypothetical protein